MCVCVWGRINGGEERKEKREREVERMRRVSYSLPVGNNSCKEEVLSNEVVEVFAVANSAVVDLARRAHVVQPKVGAGEVALPTALRNVQKMPYIMHINSDVMLSRMVTSIYISFLSLPLSFPLFFLPFLPPSLPSLTLT